MMSGSDGASPPRFALHAACASGEASQVRSLLEAASNEVPLVVNEVNARGLTPLHVASERPSGEETGEIIKLLLDAGARVNEAAGRDKATALHGACNRGNLEAVEMLLLHGADVDAVDKSRRSVLHVAVKQGNIKVIERLIEHGANVHAVDKFGRSLLHVAVQRKDLKAMDLLVGTGVDVNVVDSDGWSLVHVAVMSGDIDVLDAVVKMGGNLNTDDANGKSPLYVAIQQGCGAELIECLLMHGANVNSTDNEGAHVLHYAVGHREVAIVDIVLDHGASLSQVDKLGRSPLHAAAERGQVVTLEKLIERGVDVNAVDETGKSALYVAVGQGRSDIARFLILHGVDVHAVDHDGNTLLHAAVDQLTRNGDKVDVITLLIESGVRVNVANSRGLTPLHLACYLDRFPQAVKCLLDNGATESLIVADQDGFCPLHIAAENLNAELVKTLLCAGADPRVHCRGGENPLGIAVFVQHGTVDAVYPVVYALCSRGGNWDASCDAQIAAGKDRALDALTEKRKTLDDDQLEAYWQGRRNDLSWRLGLRACAYYWSMQHRESSDDLITIPVEVVARGEDSVRTYLRDVQNTDIDDMVYRRKICVVGPSEWGKTSLVKSLTTAEPTLVDEGDRTIGIDLSSCVFTSTACEGENEDRAKHHEVTFWDFAGQDVYHVAHSLFYSRRTLYLVCVDLHAYARTLNEANDDISMWLQEAAVNDFVHTNVFRWIRCIFSRQPDAEFVVVGTKADQLPDRHNNANEVWCDLRERLKSWQDKFVAELEGEYRAALASLPLAQEGSRKFYRSGKNDTLIQIDALKAKISAAVSNDWIVVSNAEQASIISARASLHKHLSATGRGFPMSHTYMRLLQAIEARREATRLITNSKARVEQTIIPAKALFRSLTHEVHGLEDNDCAVILRTLHDLGDILWYEREDAGALQDAIIIDPSIVVDFVREVINHNHTIAGDDAGRISHGALFKLPLWRELDPELLHAFKLLLQYFQLAYPAESREMDWGSDLIVPTYWKTLNDQSEVEPLKAFAERHGYSSIEDVSIVWWEYDLPGEISETLFEHFAVESNTSLFDRTVRANYIEAFKNDDFSARMELLRDKTRFRDTIRLQVVAPLDDDPNGTGDKSQVGWHCMRYFVMAMEKVLEAYPGLAASRFIVDVHDNSRHRVSEAVKTLQDALSMGRGENFVHRLMPWLPATLDWFIEKAWRRPGVLHDLRIRSLVHQVVDKAEILKKLITSSYFKRQFPALWTIEIESGKYAASLRILSDLSGDCFHDPIQVDLTPAFASEHGELLQDGVSILANVAPAVLSRPIVKKVLRFASSGTTRPNAQVFNLIDNLGACAGNTPDSATTSPRSKMALLQAILKLHDPDWNDLKICDLCNLQCATTRHGHYVWASRHEIMELSDRLTPCEPEWNPVTVNPCAKKDIDATQPHNPILANLIIDGVERLPAWDWRQVYCQWVLVHTAKQSSILSSGRTSPHGDESTAPTWSSFPFTLRSSSVSSIEMLRECHLSVELKRPSRLLGMIKSLGKGSVQLGLVLDKQPSSSSDVFDVPLGNMSISGNPTVQCRLLFPNMSHGSDAQGA